MLTGAGALGLFAYSSLRHALFQSTAWDLGIFDQAVYLISRGRPAISSLMGFHLLADHGALIFYPLALLYKIYPDVHWLLAVQAVSLALGATLVRRLACDATVEESTAITLAIAYLLYPLVFNVNAFDFHPETVAIPALFWGVLSARRHRPGPFIFALIVTLACKEVLGLTVAATGVWLIIGENNRVYGTIALLMGLGGFIVSTQVIVPLFGSGTVTMSRHLTRFSYLGATFPEIAKSVISKPWLVLGKVLSLNALYYLLLLALPVAWGLSPRHLAPLIGGIPTLALNILSVDQGQRELIRQYSLPLLPFLFLAIIGNIAAGGGWLKNRRYIALWSLLTFACMVNWAPLISSMKVGDTWRATRAAIALIDTEGGVLTDNQYASQVAHRTVLRQLVATLPSSEDLEQVDYVLLNLRHPWPDTQSTAVRLVDQLKEDPRFTLSYQRDDVYLFTKRPRAQLEERRFLLKNASDRCHASLAAASSYRGVVSLWKPC